MVRRHGEADLVVHEWPDDEGIEVFAAADVGALVGERDGQIAVTSAQRGERFGRLALGETHGHLGVALLEQRQGARHKRR